MADPADPTSTTVTRMLEAAAAGDARAAEDLLPLVYDELRALAAMRLRNERDGHSLQATALVHEAYIRLVGANNGQDWNSRGHFFAAAAEAMRRILIDRARRRLAEKHGGGRAQIALADVPEQAAATDESFSLLVLHEALTRLEQADPEKATLVKLRHFAGLSEAQAAGVLGISRATAARHWAFARAWLYDEVQRIRAGDDSPSEEN